MKSCAQCRREAADDATECPNCGRAFAAVPEPDLERPLTKRPSGEAFILGGQVFMLLGAAALLFGLVMPGARREYGFGELVVDPWKWRLIWGGAAAFNIALFVWAVGQIQRAIFFLPGEDRKDVG